MRVSLYLFFLTLVLMPQLNHAAPVITGTIESPKIQDSQFDEPGNPNALRENRFTLGVGLSMGSILEKGETDTASIFNLNYRNTVDPKNVEVDLTVHSKAMAGVYVGRRWPALSDSIWETYYKTSFGMYLPAKDGPAAIAALKRFQARAIIGWQNFMDYDDRVQCEVGLGASVVGFELLANIGYVISL